MNNKIAKTMLILCIIYIVGFYILKFIFPDQLLLVITDPNVLRFGKFIDSWVGYKYIINTIYTFITLYLFSCSCGARFKIKWYEALYLLIGTLLTNLVLYVAPEFYTHTSISIMLLVAMLFKGNLTYTAISFIIHGYLSQFLLSIRGFETILMKYNIASGIVLMTEGWIWLILLSLIFYLKERNNGRTTTTIPK